MRPVSIILPWTREAGMKRCVAAIQAHCHGLHYEVLACEDTERIGVTRMVKLLTDRAYHNLVMFLADDTIPQAGFLHAALDAMETLHDGWGVVGLNDDVHDGNSLATHWMADKRMLPLLGGSFFHQGYAHCFCDNELTRRAIELGRYVWAEDARIQHTNTSIRGVPMNGSYPGYREDRYLRDLLLYRRRARAGWPE